MFVTLKNRNGWPSQFPDSRIADIIGDNYGRIGFGLVVTPIKTWLQSPVEETDDRGRRTHTTAARDNRRGIPQGSPPRSNRSNAAINGG
jgi:hypothetical protein